MNCPCRYFTHITKTNDIFIEIQCITWSSWFSCLIVVSCSNFFLLQNICSSSVPWLLLSILIIFGKVSSVESLHMYEVNKNIQSWMNVNHYLWVEKKLVVFHTYQEVLVFLVYLDLYIFLWHWLTLGTNLYNQSVRICKW